MLTVFALPTALVANDAVPETVRTSPATRLSAYDTETAVVPSYVRFVAVGVTVRDRVVMVAEPVAVGLTV